MPIALRLPRISVLLSIVSLLGVVGMHSMVDKSFRKFVDKPVAYNVPSYEAVKFVAGGYERFLADVFWLAFVQYVGSDEVARIDKYGHAYAYSDLITQLDPHFEKPYWFEAWTVGSSQQRPDLADKLVQRGISFNPRLWSMPFIGGWNQFLFAHNNHRAAEYYRAAAKLPDAPDYLERQANILDSDIPEYEKRFRTMLHLYLTAKDRSVKEAARQELGIVLKKMYKQAPTELIKKNSHDKLVELGFSEEEIAE